MIKLSLLTLSLYLVLPLNAHAELYRWVDENGKVTYSDKIPPQAKNLGHAELNQQGTTLKIAPPAKSATEKAQEQAQQLQAVKQHNEAKIKAELERNLLDSYASVAELVTVYENRLALQKASLGRLREIRAKLVTELDQQREKLTKNNETEQRRMLETFIKSGEQDLKNYDQAIKQGLDELLKVGQQYQLDKTRLTALLQAQSKPEPVTNDPSTSSKASTVGSNP